MRKILTMWDGSNLAHTEENILFYKNEVNRFISAYCTNPDNFCEAVRFGRTGFALIGNDYAGDRLKEFEQTIEENVNP